ncbi:MAG: DUF167 domain-containing protein [Nitrospirae bacterium]|nr:DUF167 domain-containing protein [Nitrospirota bacterium]
MKLTVLAKPGARETRVERVDERTVRVWVRERPEGGEANRAIVRALAVFMDVAPSRLTILSGHTSRRKIIQVGD